ncbi:MAG TPA: hypothetical protein VNZ22_09575, partial [Bacillota bacterium]|nr:hypothetical protein [Bacillota bacterium]
MRLHPLLREQLEPLARRRQAFGFWRQLAGAWAVAALVALAILGLQRLVGWSSVISLPLSGLIGLALAAWVLLRARRRAPDWRAIALQLEAAHPELQGRLLTAVQQDARTSGQLDYLQQRVIEEALGQGRRNDWGSLFPRRRVALAQVMQLGALALFGWTLWQLRVPAGQGVFVPAADLEVTVTPGDAELERGSSLVVAAQFKGALPPQVELVYGPSGATNARLQLIRSLGDPLFGGTVPEVGQDLVYHLEYAGRRTRDYKITLFDYPRLERSDAAVRYPEYTGLSARQIQNTRRVSAVEGSRIDLHLQLNKMVAQASLIARGTNRQALRLAVHTNHPSATLDGFLLAGSKTYELELIDVAGRTNKLPAQFVFQALKNTTPELKIISPRGDTRPSSLEELVFEGTVFDDFGVQAFGLASVVAGKEMKVIELGQKVPGKEKRSFQYVLRLEELGLRPDDLMSWFVWADDIGPDGKVRRTSGDLYFAEVRPFDEVFREGPSMSAESQQQQQSGQSGSQAEKLADLQKQIISATWKLFRQSGQSLQPGAPKSKTEENQKGSDESNRSSSVTPAQRILVANTGPRSGQMMVVVDYQDRESGMGLRR